MSGAEGGMGGTVAEAMKKSEGAKYGRVMVEGGGNRKEKEAGMSTKMAKSTTASISHSPSPIRIAERGLDLRGKLHFLKRFLSSKRNGRRARGVSKQRTATQINRNTDARERWRSRHHHHSRRRDTGSAQPRKRLTQRNTPPSSTQAAPTACTSSSSLLFARSASLSPQLRQQNAV